MRARTKGGKRAFQIYVVIRKDCPSVSVRSPVQQILRKGGGAKAYCEFPCPPHPLHDPQMIKGHGCEQHFGRIAVGELPGEDAPELPVYPEMRDNLNIEEHLEIKQSDQDRGNNSPDNKQA